MPFDIRKILRTPHSAVSRPCEISKICVPILLHKKTSTQKCPIQICKRCSFVPMWFSFEETEVNIHQIRNTSYGLRMEMLLSHWKSSTTRNSIRNSSVCSVRPLLRMFAIHYSRMIIYVYTDVLFVRLLLLLVFLRFFIIIVFILNMLSLLTH